MEGNYVQVLQPCCSRHEQDGTHFIVCNAVEVNMQIKRHHIVDELPADTFPHKSYISGRNKQRYKFSPHWADKLRKIIAENTNYNCQWTMKQIYVSLQEKAIKFRGMCNECSAVVHCTHKLECEELRIDVSGYRRLVHTKILRKSADKQRADTVLTPIVIPLLRNGYTSKVRKHHTVNTCVFDSIFSAYATAITHYPILADYLLAAATQCAEQKNNFLACIKSIPKYSHRSKLTGRKRSQAMYNIRNELLFELYQSPTYPKSVTLSSRRGEYSSVDCMTNIIDLLHTIVQQNPILATCTDIFSCTWCTNDCDIPHLRSRLIVKNEGSLFQKTSSQPPEAVVVDAMHQQIEHQSLYQCQHCRVRRVYNKIISISVQKSVRLDNIVTNIIVDDIAYKLHGAIERYRVKFDVTNENISIKKQDYVWHMAGHIKLNGQWKCYDDLENKIKLSKLNKQIRIDMLIYVRDTTLPPPIVELPPPSLGAAAHKRPKIYNVNAEQRKRRRIK